MSMVQKRFFLLLVLAGVGFALFYAAGVWEQDNYEEEKKVRFERRFFPSLDDDSLHELSFNNEHGRVTITRTEDDSGGARWRITEPLDLETDGPVIKGLIDHLKRAVRTGEVGAKGLDAKGEEKVTPPKDLSLFGLASPRSRLSVTTTTGSKTLFLGDTNTFNGELFVKIKGEPAVLSAAAALQYQVNKSLFDLRDKRLFTFDASGVEKLKVEYEGELRYELKRKTAKREFYLVAPEEGLANQDQVGGILAVLGNLNARAFMSQNPTEDDLSRFGLRTPRLKVTLTLASGLTHVVLFSREESREKSAGFAALEGEGPIIKVMPMGLYPRIAPRLEALLDDHVLRFERDEVTRITLNSKSGKAELRRVKEGERENWRLITPKERDIRDSQVQGIFFLLETMRIGLVSDEIGEGKGLDDEIVETRGLGADASEIKLWGKADELLAELRLGLRVGDQRFVQKKSGSRILVVEAERLEGLPLVGEAFKDATAEIN